MSSRELLEMLGSGAAFGRKAQQQPASERRHPRPPPQSSINFFGSAGAPSSAAGKKRRRATADEKKGVASAASQVGVNGVLANTAARASSQEKTGDSANLALFGNMSRPSEGMKGKSGNSVAVKGGVETGEAKARSIRLEEVACFRRRMGIKVKGEEVADPMESFSEMPSATTSEDAGQTRRVLLHNVEESAWKEPTPVQMQAVPILVAGRDLLAAAPTGSGKTAAFVMPMILRLGVQRADPQASGVRGILLAPTRELAAQIHREVVRLSRGRRLRVCLLTKAGATKAAAATGMDSRNALSGYDIVVSTPMRLVALVRERAVCLASVEMVVLDEADKLFDAGAASGGSDKAFIGQVDEVLAACSHQQVQRALFSATVGQQVKELSESVLRDPIFLTVGTQNAGAADIDQRLVYVGREEGKLLAIRQLVQEGLRPPVLVFLQSKDRAKALFHELVYDGINTDVMHASRTQDQRDNIIQRFRTGEIWVLICTDLVARGIDFKGVNMVINYDFPQSAVSYIHRIGRTGRAGRHGVAVTLFTESDMDSLRSIANVMRLSGCEVPDWMLTMKKERRSDRQKRERGAPRRDGIETVSKYDKKKKRHRQFMISASKKAAALSHSRRGEDTRK
ncbi:unnamed protein product [Ectocarpus sp. 8 AP-2014]